MTQSRASQKSVTEAKPLRPFFIIWGGQTVSLLGSSLVQFALIWYLTTTTGSATVLAIASIMGLLPQILLAPIAGVFIDRWNRRLVMMVGAKDYQLKQWTVTDPQGYETTVAVSNLDTSKRPDPGMFKIDYTRYVQ